MKLNPSGGKVTYKDSYSNIYTSEWSQVSTSTDNIVYRITTEVIGPRPYVEPKVIRRPLGQDLIECLKTIKIQDIVVTGDNMPADYTMVESVTSEIVYQHIDVGSVVFKSPFAHYLNNSLTDGDGESVSGDVWGDPASPTTCAFWDSADWISVWASQPYGGNAIKYGDGDNDFLVYDGNVDCILY